MRIFISYRRDDSGYAAQRLAHDLAERFPSEVLIDVEPVERGVGFIGVVEHAVGSCNVLLAVIGDRWLSLTDLRRNRQIDDPNDLVRLEVEAALAWDVPVVIVLFEGAAAPTAEELPDSIRSFAESPSTEVTYLKWDADVRTLVETLEQVEPIQPAISVEQFERGTRGSSQVLTESLPPTPGAEATAWPDDQRSPTAASGSAARPRSPLRSAWLLAARVVLVALIVLGAFALLRSITREPSTGQSTTSSSNALAPAGWLVHRDEASGFSIAVPGDWIDVGSVVGGQLSGRVKFVARDARSNNVNVVVQPIPGEMDLQTYVDEFKKSLDQAGATDIRTSDKIVTAGRAVVLTYQLEAKPEGESNQTVIQYFLVRGSRGFVVTFTPAAGTPFDPELRRRIIGTFRFVD